VTGPGAVARNSIGIVLVGGMTIGTFFTLLVVPSIYVLIAQDHQKRLAESGAEPPPSSGDGVMVDGLERAPAT
jgi:multidrug efflux pump